MKTKKKPVRKKQKEHTEVELMMEDVKAKTLEQAIAKVRRALKGTDFNAKPVFTSVTDTSEGVWAVAVYHVFKIKLTEESTDEAQEEYANAGFLVLDVEDVTTP